MLQAAADGSSQAPDCQAGPAAPLAEQACARLFTPGVASASVLSAASVVTILPPADTAAPARRLKAAVIKTQAHQRRLNPPSGSYTMQAAVHQQDHHMPWHELQMLLVQSCSKSVPHAEPSSRQVVQRLRDLELNLTP